jgi:hypothetical protein
MEQVIEIRGAWDLSGSVFIGDVRICDLETGKMKWVSGEHTQGDYDWSNLWRP